nr:PadR family transcriptional regulator [Paenibacillus mucilaginosus]
MGILMQSDASGYDIKQQFEKLFSYFYNASYGTIYPTLSRMEREGLITKENLVQTGKPNKNIYTITEKGKEAFRRYLESDIQEVEIKSDFMTRLYFGGLAEPELVHRWLESTIRSTEQSLARLQAEYEVSQPRISPTQLLCLKIGMTNMENILKNLQEGLAQLSRMKEEGAGPA